MKGGKIDASNLFRITDFRNMDDESFLLQGNFLGNLLLAGRRNAKPISISEENNTLSLTFGTLSRFDELTPA
jgi:hypothetical protein